MEQVRGNRTQRLSELTRACSESETKAEIGEAAVSATLDLFDADAAIVAHVRNGKFVPFAAHTTTLFTGSYRSAGEGIAGRTLESDGAIVVDDVWSDDRARPTDGAYRSVLSAPLDDGVVQVFSDREGAFSEADTNDAQLLCAVVDQALERVDSEQASKRERDRLSALFDNLPDPAVRCSHRVEAEGPIVEAVNSPFVDLFGYKPEEIIGEPLVDALVPDGIEAPTERYIRGHDDTDHEVERQTTDGTRSFLLRRVPVTQQSEQTYFIYTNIEPLKQRERELQRQNERLDRFADVVSHDLRNPLTVAKGYLDFVHESDADADAIDTIDDALDRMDTIIENTLTMAKEGERVSETSRVSVPALAERAWESANTGEATLDIVGDTVIWADESRTQRLFENLFRNAREHADPDVTVEVGNLDDRPGFFVADDGPGIPPDEQEQVLEPGHSAASGSDSGTGLGLAIVSEIADAHEWDVHVTDHRTGGARFEFVTGGHIQESGRGMKEDQN